MICEEDCGSVFIQCYNYVCRTFVYFPEHGLNSLNLPLTQSGQILFER